MLIAIGFQCSFDFHQRHNSAQQQQIIVDACTLATFLVGVSYSLASYSSIEYDLTADK